jgi:hypothetical protein
MLASLSFRVWIRCCGSVFYMVFTAYCENSHLCFSFKKCCGSASANPHPTRAIEPYLNLNDTASETMGSGSSHSSNYIFRFRMYLDWLGLLCGVSTHSRTCLSWLCCLEANKRYFNPLRAVLENQFFVCFTFFHGSAMRPRKIKIFEFVRSALLVACRALVAVIWPLHLFCFLVMRADPAPDRCVF